MKSAATVMICVLGGASLALAPTSAAWAQTRPASARTAASESAPAARPRARIRVTPAYPPGYEPRTVGPYRPYATDFPVPYYYDYPGPGYVRQCSSRLVTEARLSGPVIVPHTRCRWEPGR